MRRQLERNDAGETSNRRGPRDVVICVGLKLPRRAVPTGWVLVCTFIRWSCADQYCPCNCEHGSEKV
jgi:hypothetical protein